MVNFNLCINHSSKQISIINDRFNGIPLYYYISKDGSLICSNLYYNLIKNINKNENVNLITLKCWNSYG